MDEENWEPLLRRVRSVPVRERRCRAFVEGEECKWTEREYGEEMLERQAIESERVEEHVYVCNAVNH